MKNTFLFKKKISTIIVSMLLGSTLFISCSILDSNDKAKYDIEGVVEDAGSFTRIPGAMVSLIKNGETIKVAETNMNGEFKFMGIVEGDYTLQQNATGFRNTLTEVFTLSESFKDNYYAALMTVDQSITNPLSHISGKFMDPTGKPFRNASISISAQNESLTNGYFATTVSDSEGRFAIGAISLTEPGNSQNVITSFKIRIIPVDGAPMIISNVSLINDRVQIYNKVIESKPIDDVSIFRDTFVEANQWTTTGLWNRIASNSNITNNAFPTYVKLAPNDKSEGILPNAHHGNHYYWYGDPSTGNFIGSQIDNDSQHSGGTSKSAHSGTMTSKIISIPNSSEIALQFWTWFEIESVNPNASGYDIMEIQVVLVEESNKTETLGRINPFSDPIFENRSALPFTSGGFNTAPVWTLIETDVSKFSGKDIRLRFHFNTIDTYYNGFRGWIIDDVRIIDQVEVQSKLRKGTSTMNKQRTREF